MSRLLVGLVVWVAFAVSFCPAPWDDRQVWFGRDQVLLLTAANNALAGDLPLVGAYSKEALFHPGPLFSYFLAIVQWVSRGDVALTNTIVSVVQTGTIPVLVLFAWRLSKSWLVALTLPLLIAFNFPFLFYVRIVWNVAIVLPLLALALWLTWEVVLRPSWLLPLLTFVLCFLAQAHMAYTPLAVCLGAIAAARTVYGGGANRWPILAATTGVALVCWSPVLWDAFRNEGGGNLGALLRHFGQPRRGHELWTAWGAIHGVGLQAMPRAVPLVPAVLLSAGLMISAFWRHDDDARRVRVLAVILAVIWIVAVFSISRIPDAIESYYLRPMSILLAVHLTGGVAALLLWLRQPKFALAAEAVIAAAVVAVLAPHAREEWTRFRDSSAWNQYPLREFRTAARAISADLRETGASAAAPECGPLRAGDGRPMAHVEFQPPDLSGSAASIVYLLQQEGLALSRDLRAASYRIVTPADIAETPDAHQLIRTAKFRVERADHTAARTDGVKCPPAPASLYSSPQGSPIAE